MVFKVDKTCVVCVPTSVRNVQWMAVIGAHSTNVKQNRGTKQYPGTEVTVCMATSSYQRTSIPASPLHCEASGYAAALRRQYTSR